MVLVRQGNGSTPDGGYLLLVLIVLAACLSSIPEVCSAADAAAGVDNIRKTEAAGAGVVEAVCSIIEASCIFPDDKLFLRRLAYVESTDGADRKTFRDGYFGGIWQVDRDMFDATQTPNALMALKANLTAINQTLEVDWSTVTWSDLSRPLHSALAARLYLLLRANFQTVPRPVGEQATYWKRFYRSSSNTTHFVSAVERLEKGCTQGVGADVIFVIDESGSIGSGNYAKVRRFVATVVETFEVRPNGTRVGLIRFGSSVNRWFDLGTYATKADVLGAVSGVPYAGDGTNTHLALNEVVDRGFLTTNGARQGHPHVCIVITDGASNSYSDTLVAARRLHAAGLTVFAVGVGSSLNMVELSAIASQPVCQHLTLLEGFLEIDSLKNMIEKRTCDAPLLLSMTDHQPVVADFKLAPGSEQNCKIKVQPGGATVALSNTNGSTILYTGTLTYPSSNYYENKVRSRPGHRGVLFIPYRKSTGSTSRQEDTFVFCKVEGDDVIESDVSMAVVQAADNDECKTLQPCQNEAECVNLETGWSCTCTSGWIGPNCDEPAPTTTTTTPVIPAATVANDAASSVRGTATVAMTTSLTSSAVLLLTAVVLRYNYNYCS